MSTLDERQEQQAGSSDIIGGSGKAENNDSSPDAANKYENFKKDKGEQLKQEGEDKEKEFTKEEIKKYQDTHGLEADYNPEDFGETMMIGTLTPRQISGMFGLDLQLGTKEHYWENDVIREDFIRIAGKEGDTEKELERKFDIYYTNLSGLYSQYKLDAFEEERLQDALPMISSGTGGISDEKSVVARIKSAPKNKIGGITRNGITYGETISIRNADEKQVRVVSFDENGDPVYDYVQASEKNLRTLRNITGVDGFAYSRYSSQHGESFIDIIKDGKIWDERKEMFVDMRQDQLVSSWDLLDKKSFISQIMSGSGKDIGGTLSLLKLLPRSMASTTANILDAPGELVRAGYAMWLGEDVINNETYQAFTRNHWKTSSGVTSKSDTARAGNFFTNWEMGISTIMDVSSQLLLASVIGAGSSGLAGLALSSKTVAGVKPLAAAINWTAENAVRLSLTGMASSSFYQEALDTGLSKRQSGIGAALVSVAMWKANSLSAKMLKGVNPANTKRAMQQVAKRKAADIAKLVQPGVDAIDDSFIIFNKTKGFGKAVSGLYERAEKLYYKNDFTFAMISEGSEELFEDSSTELIRQTLNTVNAIRGQKLTEMKVGEGRFKTFFDENYLSEVAMQLATATVAGGIGGPMGKIMHGSAPVSGLVNTSSFLDFHLAEKGDELDAYIDELYATGKLAPKGMLPEVNDKTGAFIIGPGKSISDFMYEQLKLESQQAKVFIGTTNLNVVQQMLDADPELKEHLDKTTMLEDLSDIAIELRKLLGKTGYGTDVLATMEDTSIDEMLRKQGEKNAVRREVLEQKVEEYESAISKLQSEKDKATEKNDKTEEERIQKEIEAQEKAKESVKDAPTIDDIDTDDVNRIRELVRRIRGFQTGFSAESYVVQMMLYADDVFGAPHLRSAEFRGMSRNLYVNTMEDTRNTINDDKMLFINKIIKSDENSERVLKVTKDNLEDIMDIFEEEPFLTKEAYKHLIDVTKELDKDTTSMEPLIEFMDNGEYVDDVVMAELERMDSKNYSKIIDENGHEYSVSEDGISEHLIAFMQTPLFKGTLQETVSAVRSYATALSETSFVTVSLSKATSEDYTTRKLNEVNFDEAAWLQQNIDGVTNQAISTDVSHLYDDNTASKALGKKIMKYMTADPRLARAIIMTRSVNPDIHLDLKVPNLNDMYNTSWIHRRVNIDNERGEMKTRNGDIVKSIKEIHDNHFSVDEGGTAASLPTSIKEELVQLRKELIIRQAQKNVLHEMTSELGIQRLATFRRLTRKNINADLFSRKRVFTQEEVHNYKEHSVISDFFNDYVADPEIIADILLKQSNNSPLTVGEQKIMEQFEIYANTIQPQQSVMLNNTTQEKIERVDDITTFAELTKGVGGLDEFESLEQAKEVLDGMLYLVRTFPMEEKSKLANEALNQRKLYVRKLLDAYTPDNQVLDLLIEGYDAKGKEVPEAIITLNTLIDELNSKKVILENDDVYVRAEHAMIDFYKAMPEVRAELGHDIFYASIAKNDIRTQMRLILLSEYKAAEFYTRYKERLKAHYTEGKIPNMEQELNALLINAFIHSKNPVNRTSISDEAFFMYVDGVAGSGKTHMLGKLALSIAADQVEFEDEKSILYASNFDRQVENLSNGLDGLDTSDKGYTKKELFSLLQGYVRGDAKAVEILDSTFVILYDEASLLNARTSGADLSLNKFKELIIQINEIRKSNKGEQGKNSKPLKVILTGDSRQVGFTDDNMTAEVSDINLWVRANNEFSALTLGTPFRFTNDYLKYGVETVKDIMHFQDSMRLQQTVWGTQPQYGGRRMGVQSILGKHGEFENLMDKTTYDNIIEQLKDPEFTVAIVPSVNTVLSGDSLMMKLINENSRVFLIPENEVQGLEYNYVITEWDPESIGDYSAVLDRTQVTKHMYTLVSRARDYVKVLNANHTTIKSTEVEGQIILASTDEKTTSNNGIYAHLQKVHATSDVDVDGNIVVKGDDSSKKDKEDAEKRKAAAAKLKREQDLTKLAALSVEAARISFNTELLSAKLLHLDLTAIDVDLYNEEITKGEARLEEIETEFKIISLEQPLTKAEEAAIMQEAKEEAQLLLDLFEQNEPGLAKIIRDKRKADEDDDLTAKEAAEKLKAAKKKKMDNQSVKLIYPFSDFVPSPAGETVISRLEEQILSKLENDNMSNLFRNTFRFLIQQDIEMHGEYAMEEIIALLEDSDKVMLGMYIAYSNTFDNAVHAAKQSLEEDFIAVRNAIKSHLENIGLDRASKIGKNKVNESVLMDEFIEAANIYVADNALEKKLLEDIIDDEVLNAVETLVTLVEQNRKKSLKKRVQDNTEGSELSNQFSEFTDQELIAEYAELIQHKDYLTLAGINVFLTRIKDNLNENGNISNKKDYIEYIRVTDLLDMIIERQLSTITLDYVDHNVILTGDDLKIATDEISNLSKENQNSSIPFISKAEIYNMERNKLSNLSIQAHPLYDSNNTKKDEQESERSIASDIISRSNLVAGESVNMTQAGTQRAVTFAEDIVSVHFIGGQYNGNPNGYYVAELNISGVTEFILMGKVFLGTPKNARYSRSLIDRVSAQYEQINKTLELVGTVNEISADDVTKGNEENILRKIFPTTHRIKQKIMSENDIISIELDTDEFINATKLGAARPTFEDNAPITIGELRNNIQQRQQAGEWVGGNIQISKHAVINMGSEKFKGVGKGHSFVLYTTASSSIIDLNDELIVQAIIDNRQFYVRAMDGRYIKADIGIIPLKRGPITMHDMYDDMYRKGTRDYDLQPFSDKNASLNGTATNVKVAKTLLHLMSYFTLPGNESIFDNINPATTLNLDKTTWGKKVTENVKNAVDKLLAKYDQTPTYYTTREGESIKGKGKVNGIKIDEFLDLLNLDKLPKGELVLNTSDIMSSILIPMLRNFGTDIYEITGKGSYPANYYSMVSTYNQEGKKNEEEGFTVTSFNTYTMIGAITREIKERLEMKGVDSDNIHSEVDKYMLELILPAMTQLFSHADVFEGYAKEVLTSDQTLLNNKKVTQRVDFHVSTLTRRVNMVGKVAQRKLVLSRGVQENDYQLSGITNLEYPALSIKADALFEAMFGQSKDKGKNPDYDPITGEKYTVRGELTLEEKMTEEMTADTLTVDAYIRNIESTLDTESRTITDLEAIANEIVAYTKLMESNLKKLDNKSIFGGKGHLSLKANLTTLVRATKAAEVQVRQKMNVMEKTQETEVLEFIKRVTKEFKKLNKSAVKFDLTKVQANLESTDTEYETLMEDMSSENKKTLKKAYEEYTDTVTGIINKQSVDASTVNYIRSEIDRLSKLDSSKSVANQVALLTTNAQFIKDEVVRAKVIDELEALVAQRALTSTSAMDNYLFLNTLSDGTKSVLNAYMASPDITAMFDSFADKTFNFADHSTTLTTMLTKITENTTRTEEENSEIVNELSVLMNQLILDCA